MPEVKKSVFATLNAINCNEHTEQKNGLTYLSWAWCWQMVKKNYPNATYTIYEREGGIPYFHDGRTAWVKTGVTIEGIEHIEFLPIMDYNNRSIPLEKITSFDMNKAIQRSLTKAAARHGLGLYIYAGEDLPDDEKDAAKQDAPAPQTTQKPAQTASKKQAGAKDYLAGGKYYTKTVEYAAQGKTSKSGEDYRTAWIRIAKPTDEQLEAFDRDVTTYRLNNYIQPAF